MFPVLALSRVDEVHLTDGYNIIKMVVALEKNKFGGHNKCFTDFNSFKPL
jgi:hypothetical protein